MNSSSIDNNNNNRIKLIIKKKNLSPALTPSISTNNNDINTNINNIDFLKQTLNNYNIKYLKNDTINHLKNLYSYHIFNNISVLEDIKIYKKTMKASIIIYNFMILSYLKNLGNCGLKYYCHNENDILTSDPILLINDVFLLIEQDGNFIYGFDIRSLYSYQLNDNLHFNNPYTKQNFTEEFISTYNRKLNFLRSNGWNVNHSIVELTEDQKFRVDVIDMFQKINDLGFYIKYEWFYDLKYVDLIKLYVNMNKFIVSINNPIYSHIFNEKKRIIDMQYDSCELSRKLISMIIIENLNKLILTGTTKEDKITKVIWFLKVFITISYEAYRCLQFLRN